MRNLRELAKQLGIKVMETDWDRYKDEPWLQPLLEAEEKERDRRSMERRVKDGRVGQFKPMTDFNWDWPKEIDRDQVEDLFTLKFLSEKANAVLIGSNGIGKTMIAQNLAYQALMKGFKARFVKASHMLSQLLEADGAAIRKRRLKRYCSTDLLVIDEVGYMNYDASYADLLYEVISERYQKKSTVVTTNKVFKEWSEIFPHAACLVTLVDRLVHNAEVVLIKGDSYRNKEAQEKAQERAQERKARKSRGRKKN